MNMKILTVATRKALGLPHVSQVIERLKLEVSGSGGLFIWSVLPEEIIDKVFSLGVRSGWFLF